MSTSDSGVSGAPDSEPLLHAWLTLISAPGVSSGTLGPLLAQNPDPRHWIAHASDPLLPLRLRHGLAQLDEEVIERNLRWLEGPDRHLVTLTHPEYPLLLRDTPDPPVALFVLGDPAVLPLPQIAMVGSRNPTESGRRTAHDFAAHLAAKGLVVTSGLALGVDGACHAGALASNSVTIAVTGTGLDRVYPARHRELAHRIVDSGGALISEFPPGAPPRPGHFPRRNRIISGLALGTLIVEAGLKSGSLITARQALEQGREVFAIPGSIHNPMARGCHALIRDGAKLVETAQDVVEDLGALLGHLATAPAVETQVEPKSHLQDPDYQALLNEMGYDPVSIDFLVHCTGRSAAEISSMILLLELEGHVSSAPGGLFARNR